MAEEKKAEGEEQAPKKGSKLVIIGLVITNLMALGGLGAFVLMGSPEKASAESAEGGKEESKSGEEEKSKEKGAEEGKEEEKSEDKEGEKEGSSIMSFGDNDLGPVAHIGTFTINLNEPGHPRYLKTMLDVEVDSSRAKDEVKARTPQIRDIVISFLSSLNLDRTRGAKAKVEIRRNLTKRINAVMTAGEVRRVFLVEFVTQ